MREGLGERRSPTVRDMDTAFPMSYKKQSAGISPSVSNILFHIFAIDFLQYEANTCKVLSGNKERFHG